MACSIIISGRNTLTEWNMVPTSRPVVNPPPVKSYQVDIPGTDGELDYTEVFAGRPLYGQRTGSWEFWIKPGRTWASVYASLLDFLHGKQHSIVLEDDPEYTYEGRLSINEWRSEQANSILVIDYNLGPYKRDRSGGKSL